MKRRKGSPLWQTPFRSNFLHSIDVVLTWQRNLDLPLGWLFCLYTRAWFLYPVDFRDVLIVSTHAIDCYNLILLKHAIVEPSSFQSTMQYSWPFWRLSYNTPQWILWSTANCLIAHWSLPKLCNWTFMHWNLFLQRPFLMQLIYNDFRWCSFIRACRGYWGCM